MTTSTDDLIAAFSDGKMPTGANFEALITSMVSQTEFKQQTADFDDWVRQGLMQFGVKGDGWTLKLASPAELALAPDKPDATPRKAAGIDLYGFTRAFGRLGACDDRGAFARPLIDRARLASAPANGEWTAIIDMPAGLAAFEIVAATEPATPRYVSPIVRALRFISGWSAPGAHVVHAVATASAINVEPRIAPISTTEATRLWRQTRLLLAALLILLVGLGLVYFSHLWSYIEPAAKNFDLGLGGNFAKLFDKIDPHLLPDALLLLALRRAAQIYRAYATSLRLQWRPTGGAASTADRKWGLHISAPKNPDAPGAVVNYHITVLWG